MTLMTQGAWMTVLLGFAVLAKPIGLWSIVPMTVKISVGTRPASGPLMPMSKKRLAVGNVGRHSNHGPHRSDRRDRHGKEIGQAGADPVPPGLDEVSGLVADEDRHHAQAVYGPLPDAMLAPADVIGAGDGCQQQTYGPPQTGRAPASAGGQTPAASPRPAPE